MTHEIDSAYWEEWKLFRLPGGINLFLILHFPLLFLLLFGLVQIHHGYLCGYILSLFFGLAGVAGFVIYMTFIGKGRPEFRKPVSLAILITMLPVSLLQVGLTIYHFVFHLGYVG
jgi:hypothetical protein